MCHQNDLLFLSTLSLYICKTPYFSIHHQNTSWPLILWFCHSQTLLPQFELHLEPSKCFCLFSLHWKIPFSTCQQKTPFLSFVTERKTPICLCRLSTKTPWSEVLDGTCMSLSYKSAPIPEKGISNVPLILWRPNRGNASLKRRISFLPSSVWNSLWHHNIDFACLMTVMIFPRCCT